MRLYYLKSIKWAEALIISAHLLYKENPVFHTGFIEAMRLNNNFATAKL